MTDNNQDNIIYPEAKAVVIDNNLNINEGIPIQITTPVIINDNNNIDDNNIESHTYIYVEEKEERYCGPVSCLICVLTSFLFLPAIVFIPFCPCDIRKKRKVYER